MKLKHIYLTLSIVFLCFGLALFKLNEHYKNEKTLIKKMQIQTQLNNLSQTIMVQLSQLKNTLSAYENEIQESKINWVQLKPFFALSEVEKTKTHKLSIKSYFNQTEVDQSLQSKEEIEALFENILIDQEPINVKILKDKKGEKYIAILFFESLEVGHQKGLMVIGEAQFFQRFFDAQKQSLSTQSLIGYDQLVAAHTEYDYVGKVSNENKISEDKFILLKKDIRGVNLSLLSYAIHPQANFLQIPYPVLGTLVGLVFVFIGLLFVFYKEESPLVAKMKSFQPKIFKPKDHLSEILNSDKDDFEFIKMKQPSKVNPKDLVKDVDQNVKNINIKDVLKVNIQELASENSQTSLNQKVTLLFEEEQPHTQVKIHAPLQQALYKTEKLFKKNKIKVNRDYKTTGEVKLDYLNAVKVFDYVFKSMANEFESEINRQIFISSYENLQDQPELKISSLGLRFFLTSENEKQLFEALKRVNLKGQIVKKLDRQVELVLISLEAKENKNSSTNELQLKSVKSENFDSWQAQNLDFAKSEAIQSVQMANQHFKLSQFDFEESQVHEKETSFNSSSQINSEDLLKKSKIKNESIFEMTDTQKKSNVQQEWLDLDIDSILNFDKIEPLATDKSPAPSKEWIVEKQLKTQFINIDRKPSLSDEPRINVDLKKQLIPKPKSSSSKIKIRRPEKT